MRSILHTGLTTLGLAAAIGAPMLGTAEEDLVSAWSQATTLSGGDNKVEVKIGAKLTASAFYHDVDDEWSSDLVYRGLSTLNGGLLPIPPAPTAAELAAYVNNGSALWYNGQKSFADGILINDAEFYLNVKAYGHFVAGIKFEGAKSDSDAEIDNWYFGISGIPYLGQVDLRDVDIQQGPMSKDLFMRENSIAHECFELDDLVGIHVENKKAFDGNGRFWFAFGIHAGEPGATDTNWQGQGGVAYTLPINKDSNTNLMVGVDAELRNRSPNNHGAYSDNLSLSVAPDYGPTVVTLTGSAEEAIIVTPSAAFTTGPFYAGVEVNWADVSAATEPSPMDTVMNAYLVALYGGGPLPAFVNTVSYEDWSAMGFTFETAFSLTGENQSMGGGIKKPAHMLDMKNGSGYGAFEAVARFSMVQLQDEASQQDRYLTPGVAVLGDFLNASMYTAANREEGGEATQITLGVNWYPCAALRCGLFFNVMNWSYDDGAVTINAARNTGVVMPTAMTLPNLLLYSGQSGIKNDYTVQSFYLAGQAKF